MRVVVIDDERVVCTSCRRVLQEQGFDVTVALNGRDGVEKVSQQDFDVVILDLKMPGLAGMDVLRIIKRNKPDTRVLIITGYSSVTTAVEAMQWGAGDYLPKPFTPEELIDKVSRMLRSPEVRTRPGLGRTDRSSEVTCLSEAEKVKENDLAQARILLAGTDTEEMASLYQCLSVEPWKVTMAEKLEEVIEMVRADQGDVLITGVDVLGMKAYELIPEIRRVGSSIPIIVACADPSLELARRIREFGIFFYLMEPFDPEEARAAVRDAYKKAVMLRRHTRLTPVRGRLVRHVRTIAKDGTRVGFIVTGGWMDENSDLYREIMGELKRRAMPMHAVMAREAVSAEEFPSYLEQDDRVIIVAAFDANCGSGRIATYSGGEFERLATDEQRREMREVAYPEAVNWLEAQGIAPQVKVVCLPRNRLAREFVSEAASIIVREGLS